MNLQQLQQLIPPLVDWIETTLAAHALEARPVSSYSFRRLPSFYATQLLSQTKVVEVDRIPMPPLNRMGLSEFASFQQGDYAGITYFDTYFVKRGHAHFEALHFHELVHVLQWQQMGPEQFLMTYASGLLEHGYRDSPLEVMAYELQQAFESSAAPFDVQPLVEQQLFRLLQVGGKA